MRSPGLRNTQVPRALLLALWVMSVMGFFQGSEVLRAQEPSQQEAEVQDDSFDPVRAYNDMKVGDYYFKKGRYDAAIARYEDAARHKPGYAIPFLRIAKACEKKHDPKGAIEAYKKYLKILPKGSDADNARKQIEKLEREKRG
jgi:tetratricopeptide (TPR) repeat protein